MMSPGLVVLGVSQSMASEPKTSPPSLVQAYESTGMSPSSSVEVAKQVRVVAVSTPVSGVMLRLVTSGVVLSAGSPVSAPPVSVGDSPVSDVPVSTGDSPVSGTPVSGSPVSASPVSATPVSATPVSSTSASVSEVPVSSASASPSPSMSGTGGPVSSPSPSPSGAGEPVSSAPPSASADPLSSKPTSASRSDSISWTESTLPVPQPTANSPEMATQKSLIHTPTRHSLHQVYPALHPNK